MIISSVDVVPLQEFLILPYYFQTGVMRNRGNNTLYASFFALRSWLAYQKLN